MNGLRIVMAAGSLLAAGCAEETASAGSVGQNVSEPPAQTASQRYVTTTSVFDFEETLRRLLEAIDRRDLTVFAVIDHRAGAAEVDLEMPPAVAVIFGSPQIGTSLMVTEPRMTAELPIRASVYVNRNGDVIVATMSPRALLETFPALSAEREKILLVGDNLQALRSEAAGSEG